MVLWTVQNIAVMDVLNRRGVIRGDWRRVCRFFRPAYEWMAGQLYARGVAPKPCCPIWAWYAWRGEERRRPDLRSSGLAAPGESVVRIEIEVDDSRVLLSDFDSWHAVLNGWHLSRCEQEMNDTDRGIKEGRLGEKEMRHSWEGIFDLTGGDPAWCGKPEDRMVQAAMYEVRLDDVRAVRPFVGRGSKP